MRFFYKVTYGVKDKDEYESTKIEIHAIGKEEALKKVDEYMRKFVVIWDGEYRVKLLKNNSPTTKSY